MAETDPLEAQHVQDAIVQHVLRSLDKRTKVRSDQVQEIVLVTLATLYLFGITSHYQEE